jgi:L-iditol 2-dehydrogenase
MKAAILTEPGKFSMQDISKPEPAPGEVRVKLMKVGICGSDVHLFLGHRKLNTPTIIGHEGIGIIDALGKGVIGRSLGERVAIEPNIPCRHCEVCMKGKSIHCPHKTVIGLNVAGCFAEYVCLPSAYAWQLPDGISDEDAVTIEPMAVAVHALFSSSAKPGDSIAVIGLGAIGLLLTHLATALGYQVFVTEINPAKKALAVSMGAEVVMATGDEEEAVSTIGMAYDHHRVVTVFECAGVAATVNLAIAAAPRCSEVLLLGLSENPAQFLPLKTVRDGIRIIPALIYDHPFDFRRTIQLIASGIIHPGKIISGYYRFDEMPTAMERAASGHESKLVIDLEK